MKTSITSEYIKNFQDFIPITCHYDSYTLITKNGELIQIIRLDGGSDLDYQAQQAIRDSIKKNILDENFAFWIHTIRSKTDLDDHAEYDNIFSANLHEILKNEYSWNAQFINTIYISIVYARPVLNIYDPKTFIPSLSISYVSGKFTDHLDAAHLTISKVTDAIISDLLIFHPHKLGVYSEGEISYSESLSLFHYLVHLESKKIPVPIVDLGPVVATNRYVVGNSEIEIVNGEHRRFATVLAIKEYHNIESNKLNELLQLPVELITTEVVYFITKKEAMQDLYELNNILTMSKDTDLRNNTIAHIVDYDGNESTSFCHQQISIMIMNDNLEALRNHTTHISSSLSDLGIVFVQEDIALEHMFFVQMPSNFSFLQRVTTNVIDSVAGFVSLNNCPLGDKKNPWGNYVALMYTTRHTPHYINFHNGNKGHTIVLGNDDSDYTILINFLIAQSLKYRPTVIYITSSNKSQIFIEAVGGIWADTSASNINIEPETIVGYQLTDASTDLKSEIIKKIFDITTTMVHLGPKIIVIDDATILLEDKKYDDQISQMMDKLHNNNGILVCGANIEQYLKLWQDNLRYQQLFSNSDTKIICNYENSDITSQNILQLSDIEYAMVKSSDRIFLYKQGDYSEELFLDFIPTIGLYKMLSCDVDSIEITQNVQKESNPKEWVISLYDKLNSNMA